MHGHEHMPVRGDRIDIGYLFTVTGRIIAEPFSLASWTTAVKQP
jgi:hypothetical protein